MKVERMVKMNVNHYEVGDIIKFKLNNNEKVKALAVKEENECMIFCMVDCLQKRYTIDEVLNGILNREILNLFSDKIINRMVAFGNKELLRLPKKEEIFGTDDLSPEENNAVQFKPMKDAKNRITYDEMDNCFIWWWLNSDVFSDFFPYVGKDGNFYECKGDGFGGVRPLFKLMNQ